MELKIRLFNVGQGDHILLELPDGSFGIIDFYYSASKGWTLPPACVFLENLRMQLPKKEIKIAFICISHPDIDHIKGLNQFLKWVERYKIPVEQIWRYPGHNPGQMKIFLDQAFDEAKLEKKAIENNRQLNPNLEALDNFVRKKKVSIEYLKEVRDICNKIAGLVDAKSLAPLGKHVHPLTANFWIKFFLAYLKGKKPDLKKKNVLSSIVQLIFGKFNILFGGDTELDIWEDCIAHCEKNKLNISWEPDFIKISHHGSKNSSSTDLWKKLLANSSTYIGISAWKKMHPHSDTIEHISQAAAFTKNTYKILGTSVCTNCANISPFDAVKALWITKNEIDTYDKHVLEKSHSKIYKKMLDSQRLVSYILTFSLSEPLVKVEKEMFTADYTQICIYKNPASEDFPQCVF